jgi:hypothetical protein
MRRRGRWERGDGWMDGCARGGGAAVGQRVCADARRAGVGGVGWVRACVCVCVAEEARRRARTAHARAHTWASLGTFGVRRSASGQRQQAAVGEKIVNAGGVTAAVGLWHRRAGRGAAGLTARSQRAAAPPQHLRKSGAKERKGAAHPSHTVSARGRHAPRSPRAARHTPQRTCGGAAGGARVCCCARARCFRCRRRRGFRGRRPVGVGATAAALAAQRRHAALARQHQRVHARQPASRRRHRAATGRSAQRRTRTHTDTQRFRRPAPRRNCFRAPARARVRAPFQHRRARVRRVGGHGWAQRPRRWPRRADGRRSGQRGGGLE